MTQPPTALHDPLQSVKGVGAKLAAALQKKLQLATAEDLLLYAPVRYEDRSHIVPIKDVRPDSHALIAGTVLSCFTRRIPGRRMIMTEAILSDGAASITATWFNQPYLKKNLAPGTRLLLYGPVKFYNKLRIGSPSITVLDEHETPAAEGMVPVYGLSHGVSQKVLRKIIRAALLSHGALIEDCLPPRLLRDMQLPPLAHAVRAAHRPGSAPEAADALRRLKFDELLLHGLLMAQRHRQARRKRAGKAVAVSDAVHERILKRFPFTLTGDQLRAIADIRADLAGEHSMYRLLQGDVGSGKTAVALYAALAVIAAKQQAAFMAPTEILAEQHFQNISRYLRGSRVRVGLLTASLVRAERDALLRDIAAGKIDLVIGTHALIQHTVKFNALRLAIIDEQHKFGVMQRAALIEKGRDIDLLVMTATPIPRTLTLSVYGDLDVSAIKRPPPGRKPIRTQWVKPAQQDATLAFIKEQLRLGQQAYFVYPIIDESDTLDLKAAKDMFNRLVDRTFPEFEVALLHGQMKLDERTAVMNAFVQGRIAVLVATTVIEVGIDVPNASIMVIEEAQKFGLSQLHQLRGRVGRGGEQSYCFLFANARTREAAVRLKTLEDTADGFAIAEADLKLRGPGELLGVRQSGLPEFRLADLVNDYALLREATQAARGIVRADPQLALPEHRALRERLRRLCAGRTAVLNAG